MEVLEALDRAPPAHRVALEWFQFRRGREISWPDPLPDGTFLVNKAKGIHKPRGWLHALSIREVLNGPYPDTEPEFQADGSWRYRYFQEGKDPAQRDRYFTNRGLVACMNDGMPVGVLRQVKGPPYPRYKVFGLAFVTRWDDGWFTFASR